MLTYKADPDAVPGTGTSADKEAQREQIISTAFDDIFSLYDDPAELSTAITTTDIKIERLKKEVGNVSYKIEIVDNYLKRAITALGRLDAAMSGHVFTKDSAIPKLWKGRDGKIVPVKTLASLLPVIETAVEESEHTNGLHRELVDTRANIEKAERFLRMLEGIKSVADVNGMERRPKVEECKEELKAESQGETAGQVDDFAKNDENLVVKEELKEDPMAIPQDEGQEDSDMTFTDEHSMLKRGREEVNDADEADRSKRACRVLRSAVQMSMEAKSSE